MHAMTGARLFACLVLVPIAVRVTLYAMDKNGKYLRTLYPFRADLTNKQLKDVERLTLKDITTRAKALIKETELSDVARPKAPGEADPMATDDDILDDLGL